MGSNIQVEFSVDNTEIEVISVVNLELDGALPTGVRVGTENGWIVSYNTLNDGRMTVTIATDRVLINDVYKYFNYKSYEVATDWQEEISNYGFDARIVFDIGSKYGDTNYIYNIGAWENTGAELISGSLPRLGID